MKTSDFGRYLIVAVAFILVGVLVLGQIIRIQTDEEISEGMLGRSEMITR